MQGNWLTSPQSGTLKSRGPDLAPLYFFGGMLLFHVSR